MKHLPWIILFLLQWLSCKTPDSNPTASANNNSGFCTPGPIDLNTAPGKDGKLAPLFPGLDVYHYAITTSSKEAQRYFDQGFVLNYGFNHAEAARSFREAIRLDPECAMCYWGLAYVLGPNYNAGMEPEVLIHANDALVKANMYKYKATPRERALIDALSKRYPPDLDTDPQPYYQAYADAMRTVQKQYPDDPDITAMTAESLMDLHPWQIWKKNGDPQPWTEEIVSLVEHALALEEDHPQAMHLYMHALEAGPNPEKALAVARRLEFRVPGSGHLLHMPSHLYINTGHYHEGSLANERAVKVDSTYVESCHAAGIYPLGYYPHNWHFLAACAALEGRGDRALEASRYMADFVVDKELMYVPALAGLQHYYTIPWYIMVKFAKWEEILAEPAPDEKLVYPTAIWAYAQGMAHAAKGDFAQAKAKLAVVAAAARDTAIQDITVFDINKISDLVVIAENVLAGDIARRQGNHAEAVAKLRAAVAREDLLNYNEPPDWFFSVRHLLGEALLQAGNAAAAEKVYREDLRELKNNGWALIGLHRSLKAQGKTEEAAAAKARFDEAWRYADVELNASVL